MAAIPRGATEMTFDEAMAYHRSWTESDRKLVRDSLARCYRDVISIWANYDGWYFDDLNDPDGVDFEESLVQTVDWVGERHGWYVPPSGSYVAGYWHKSRYSNSDRYSNGVNYIYLHAGFIRMRCETSNPVEVELSGRTRSSVLTHSAARDLYPVCDRCWLQHAPGDCD